MRVFMLMPDMLFPPIVRASARGRSLQVMVERKEEDLESKVQKFLETSAEHWSRVFNFLLASHITPSSARHQTIVSRPGLLSHTRTLAQLLGKYGMTLRFLCLPFPRFYGSSFYYGHRGAQKHRARAFFSLLLLSPENKTENFRTQNGAIKFPDFSFSPTLACNLQLSIRILFFIFPTAAREALPKDGKSNGSHDSSQKSMFYVP
jgi:hypothetical protein